MYYIYTNKKRNSLYVVKQPDKTYRYKELEILIPMHFLMHLCMHFLLIFIKQLETYVGNKRLKNVIFEF